MPLEASLPSHSVIVPRKGVIESDAVCARRRRKPLRVQIGSNNIRAHVGDFIFNTRSWWMVVSPDYRRVLPKNPDKHLEAAAISSR